jgi:hypothetical protein
MNLKNDVKLENVNKYNLPSIKDANNKIKEIKDEKNISKNNIDNLLNNLFDSYYKNKLDGKLN